MVDAITGLLGQVGLSSQAGPGTPSSPPDNSEHDNSVHLDHHDPADVNGEGDGQVKSKKKRKKLTPAQKRARDQAAAAASAPRISTLKVITQLVIRTSSVANLTTDTCSTAYRSAATST